MNVKIFGIAYECPHEIRENDCPVHAIELLSFKEKVAWVKLQDKENIQTIIGRHECCSRSREQKVRCESSKFNAEK